VGHSTKIVRLSTENTPLREPPSGRFQFNQFTGSETEQSNNKNNKKQNSLSVTLHFCESSVQLKTITMSTMHLASLNIDALLYLLEFVDPVDRFNLVLSGILKGFDNVNKGMDLRKR